MTNLVSLYQQTKHYQVTCEDFQNGASLEDDHFLQAVMDGVYNFLSEHFTDEEQEEIDEFELVDEAFSEYL